MRSVLKPAVASVAYLSLVHAVAAQQSDQSVQQAELEEVVVTGTLISGALRTGSIPVQVISDLDLEKRGSPSTLDMLKELPAISNAFGETNRLAGQIAGGYTVNLRGLGPDKTLVLLNGRRMPTLNVGGFDGAVDAALIPKAAIARVEVLTDGGAATYGSDAIAGVVNFITKPDFEGLKIDGNYTYISDTDGDYEANIAWGTTKSWGNFLVTLGYNHRSELNQADRDWAIYAYDGGPQPTSRITNPNINPQNGYAASGNPGAYIIPASFTAEGFTVGSGANNGRSFVDPACETFAGFLRGTGNSARCIYHNAPFNALVDDVDGYQVFAQLNVDLSANHQFHFEALFSGHNVPHDVQQPSYAPSNFPLNEEWGGNNPVPAPAGQDRIRGYYIPPENPGLQTLLALYPEAFSAQDIERIQQYGVMTNSVAGAWRPYGYGGNPLTGDAFRSKREGNAFRISTGFSGDLPFNMRYDANVTYGRYVFERYTAEIVVENLQWALRGLGGFGCTPGGSDPATSTPGQGPCLWFNPFSTGVERNAQTGQINPMYAAAVALNPQAANSREVAEYLQAYGYDFHNENRTGTIDLALSGQLPWQLWAGRNISWALGAQYLRSWDIQEVPPETNLDTAPCPATGVTDCLSRTGPLTFFGALPGYDLVTSRYAIYGELHLPITADLEAQVAARYEDLGDAGTTTDPKLALRWQVTDWLAMRGSASTTFRAPSPWSATGMVTSGFVVAQLGQFKATDRFGNPNLRPESAENYNLGLIFTTDFGLTASVDYYEIHLKDVIETDSAANMVAAFFGSSVSSPNHCTSDPNDPYWGLQQRFTFTGGVGDPATCGLQNLQRIRLTSDNKQDYDVTGIDVVIDYRLPFSVFGGDMRIGADGNYVFKYRGTGSYTEGILITQGRDYAGTTNFNALPRWKGNLYVEYAWGSHNVRATIHYVDGLENDSPSIFPANATNLFAKRMEPWKPIDLVYRAELPWDTVVTASVFNLLDRDPPAMRQDFGYNTFTANPLGRYFRLALSKKF
jgi:iron complex outermembrane receptor protein